MKIEKIAVFGAGTMGSAIAQHFCMKGLAVTIVDLKPEALERSVAMIRRSLEEAKDKKVLSEEALHAALARVKCTTNLADIANSDLVVEAVFEDRKVKKELFKTLENHFSPGCILASNTSSFLISDLALDLKHPERFVGVHYFYHAAKNKLVEVIPGKKTNPDLASEL